MSDIKDLSRLELLKTLQQIFLLLRDQGFTEDDRATRNQFVHGPTYYSFTSSKLTPNKHTRNLQSLIGTIPFLMMNEQIFEKNQDIANFAQSLGINIPTPEKKKREDIIGRLIVAIAKFDQNKIQKLNTVIKDLSKPTSQNTKSTFFSQWDTAIKKIKF